MSGCIGNPLIWSYGRSSAADLLKVRMSCEQAEASNYESHYPNKHFTDPRHFGRDPLGAGLPLTEPNPVQHEGRIVEAQLFSASNLVWRQGRARHNYFVSKNFLPE